jgi:hypothetical protein
MNYKFIYNNLINQALTKIRVKQTGIYEQHHIIPKCLGGSNNKNNLVLLTPKSII